jgi:hypothetical protein
MYKGTGHCVGDMQLHWSKVELAYFCFSHDGCKGTHTAAMTPNYQQKASDILVQQGEHKGNLL